MSTITILNNDLLRYKAERELGKALRDIKLTPSWKKLIELGFLNDFAKASIDKLATCNKEDKEQVLAELTSISIFEKYLNEITTKGEEAVDNIRTTEEALTQLRGQ